MGNLTKINKQTKKILVIKPGESTRQYTFICIEKFKKVTWQSVTKSKLKWATDCGGHIQE